ncbi:MAG: adenylate/guanylate cyclase domain-containing protein [Sedimentisphaerales bacterium]|nr:adenylate/guanylate cyclase domain-containing protein [Sedimentisphaerales bacterium]
MFSRPHRSTGKTIVGLLIGMTATVIIAVIAQFLRPNYLELRFLDLRHRLFPVQQRNPNIATVVIDDNALEQIGRWPWPRSRLAEVITVCAEAGASQIVLDVLIPEEQLPEVKMPGVTDLSQYGFIPDFARQSEPQIINNDQILAQAIAQAANCTVPFYAQLYHQDSDQQYQPDPCDQFACQIRDLIAQQEGPVTFYDLYYQVYPDSDILDDNQQRKQLLLAYMWGRSTIALEKFGFLPEHAPQIPIYYFGKPTPPVPLFAESAANTGFASVEEDSDSAVRRVPLVAQYEGRFYKQLVFAAACRALGVNDYDIDLSQPDQIILTNRGIRIPLDETGCMTVAWLADWADDPCNIPITFPASVAQMRRAITENNNNLARIDVDNIQFQLSTIPQDISSLDPATQTAVQQMRNQLEDAQALRQANDQLAVEIENTQQYLHDRLNGKIVLLGSVATGEAGARDFVPTPISRLTPGVMVHRNALNTILQQAFIYRAPASLDFIITLTLGFLMTLVTAMWRPLFSGLLLIVFAPIAIIVNFIIVFGMLHYWYAIVSPVAAVLASFAAVTFYRQITEGRDRRRITARFKQYVSPSVVDKIVSSAKGFTFAGELREITCYFSDLAGFTTTSEHLGPEKTVSVLNIYLDRMTEVLDQYDATINKFEGDGVFAFFGAPVHLPDHPRRACLAALAAQQALTQLVTEQQAINPDFPSLKMRIGISSGPVVVGDCGSHRKFDYTAIGDTVNLSARLESGNKYFGSKLMISDATYQHVADELAVRPLGKVRVVGKKIGIGINELLGRHGSVPQDLIEYSQKFAQAVKHFQNQQFDQAKKIFQDCLKQRPDDIAAILYLSTIEQLLANPIPPEFDGCLELTGK